ncbi:hypothetical protein ZIOFF_030750 [Zingiber officinale]|uniref:Retrovirus-related Pol polyprotein from transposon TNT 1-94-like beta-barrel domain-containing protein n=1 Tax=Zingiber officinale TaxID=94328 RepID=A0A8J5H9Q3_ZINOF|nr:hypothetical protein ZIOFF_030750 [Zingiber officinale]
MKGCGDTIQDKRIVKKVLRSLPLKFDYVDAVIEESKDLSNMTIYELTDSLLAHEQRINRSNAQSTEQAFKSKQSSIYTESATDVWNDLQDKFSQENDTRIFDICQEIAELRQGHQSASIYYTKMKALWEELSSYHDPNTCTCGGLKGFAEREEKERVMQFLMSLNDSFSIIRGSILLMNHLPDTRKVHALILQHERQSDMAVNRNNSGHVVNFAQPKTQNHISSRQVTKAESHHLTGNNRLYCTNFEMDGHTIDRYFYIHGFPPGHRYHGKDIKPKGKKSINSSVVPNMERSETKQLTTKEYDQIMALLRKEIGNTEPLINTSGIDSIYASSTWILDNGAIDHEKKDAANFSKEEQHEILFYSQHGYALKHHWYLDSGASNHMTGNKELFVELNPNISSSIILGVGTYRSVKGKDTIVVQTKEGNKNLIIDILYVPSLSYNLLSIGQLIQKDFSVHFDVGSAKLFIKRKILLWQMLK